MLRLIRIIALLGLVGAAAVIIRALLDSEDPAPAPAPPAPTAAPPPPTPTVQPTAPPPVARPSPANGSSQTRDELYKRAQELNVKGRSKMSKDELGRAVTEAERE